MDNKTNEEQLKVLQITELRRIADALEEVLRLVKVDQAKTAERYKEYDKESKDPFIKTMEEGERE